MGMGRKVSFSFVSCILYFFSLLLHSLGFVIGIFFLFVIYFFFFWLLLHIIY